MLRGGTSRSKDVTFLRLLVCFGQIDLSMSPVEQEAGKAGRLTVLLHPGFLHGSGNNLTLHFIYEHLITRVLHLYVL